MQRRRRVPLAPTSLAALASLMAAAFAVAACSDDPTSPDAGASDATADTAGDSGDDVAADADPDATDLTADADPDTAPDADAAPDGDLASDASADADAALPELLTAEEALALVDPFIGTGGLGFNYAALTPAAQVPFGMVRVGPDSTVDGGHPDFMHFSGYHYGDTGVRGFSHTHFVGTGVADYGNVRLLPIRDLGERAPGTLFARWDKDSEVARPGYYSVELPLEGVLAEMSATTRAAVHRYTFGERAGVEGADPGLIAFDAAAYVGSGTLEDSAVAYDEESGEVTGWVRYRGPYTGRQRPYTIWFSATFDPAPDAVWSWDAEGYDGERVEASGSVAGLVLRWDEPTASPVEARVGISYVDGEQAALHRTLEVEGASLEEVREAATALWLEKLGRIRFGGLSESDARVFATAIYNTYRMPTTLSGADGRYRGLDGEVHEAEGFTYYTDLSLWDTFRTFHPWLALTDPEEQRNCLRSLERMQQEGGYYPRWPAAISYTNGMIGTSADIVLAESALKGFDDAIDWDAAFDSLYETATQPTEAGSGYGGRGGIDDYLTLGYLPEERHSSSVSRVLEYAWNDWALANLAEHLGREEAEELRGRGRSFLTLFHEDSLFFRPRLEDGSFDTSVPVSRIEMGGGAFTEGTAWHWRFYALHEVEAFAEAMGGAEAMGDALEEFFARSALGRGTGHIDHKLPDVHYWHGNEPALHSAYLFHHAGRPERLQHWVREIQTRVYWDDEAGLPGNDDGGTMSTWYLFNGVGLYPLAGSDRYFVSTPLAPVAEIETAGGVLRIEAPGASAERRFVRSLTLDGVPVDGYELRHADLQDATLRFEMSAEAP